MRFLAAFLLAALGWLVPAHGQQPLPVPALTARVIDQTGTLDEIQRKGLEDKLAAFEQQKGTQMVFLLVRSTQPEDIASYANRVANAWKIGRRDVGDGILLVVARDDRRVRIEVAKSLEGAVPDLAARRIIEDAITPKFRQGDYFGGLQGAADQLIARVSGEKLPEPAQPEAGSGAMGAGGFQWFDLAIFLFIAVPVVGRVVSGIFGRKFGALLTGGGVGFLAMAMTSSLVVAVVAGVIGLFVAFLWGSGLGTGRHGGGYSSGPWIGTGGGGGGWSSGGGGGGFSSGGGGDFGGGGASGDW